MFVKQVQHQEIHWHNSQDNAVCVNERNDIDGTLGEGWDDIDNTLGEGWDL